MRQIVQLVSCLLLCAIIQPLQAATVPSRINVAYDVLKGKLKIATITETFIRSQDHYSLESVSDAVGLLALFKPETIRVTSEGTLTQAGLRPAVFSSKRKIDSERNNRAEFDWVTKRISLYEGNGKRTLPLPADTQDRLSAMYQFLFLKLSDTTTLDFHMTNGIKLDIYNYLVTTGPRVSVPLGEFRTLYVASVPEAGASKTEIWLATEHANFPCKMTITDADGGQLTQVLTRFDAMP